MENRRCPETALHMADCFQVRCFLVFDPVLVCVRRMSPGFCRLERGIVSGVMECLGPGHGMDSRPLPDVFSGFSFLDSSL